jgi:hypothetical protein
MKGVHILVCWIGMWDQGEIKICPTINNLKYSNSLFIQIYLRNKVLSFCGSNPCNFIC